MRTHRFPALMAAASLVLLAGACSDDPKDGGTDPQLPGNLAIATHTTGESLDLNGYLCSSELGEDWMGANAEMVAERIAEDMYTIRLSSVADNCVVAHNPIYAIVQPGHTTNVQFDVTCEAIKAPKRPAPDAVDDCGNLPCKFPRF